MATQPMVTPPVAMPSYAVQQPLQLQAAPFQQPIIIAGQQAQELKSCGLIGVGIVLILLSSISMALCGYVISKVAFPNFIIAELACGVFFFLTAIFAIHGGNNVWKRHCSVSTAASLGALGLLAAIVAIILDVLAAIEYPVQCEKVDISLDLRRGISLDTNQMCYIEYLPILIALIAFAILEAIFGLIISCSACCNTCSCCCCYEAPPITMPQIIQPATTMLPIGVRSDQYAYTRLDV